MPLARSRFSCMKHFSSFSAPVTRAPPAWSFWQSVSCLRCWPRGSCRTNSTSDIRRPFADAGRVPQVDPAEPARIVVGVLDLLPAAISVDGVCGTQTAAGCPHRADPVDPPSLAAAELSAGAPGAPFCRRKSGAIHGEQRHGRRHHNDGLNPTLHDLCLLLRQFTVSATGYPVVVLAVDYVHSIF